MTEFLIAALRKFGFGESFIDWIIIYHNPNVPVRSNRRTDFLLGRVTRQGCPLPPSLFAIFTEPLAAAIRQRDGIEEIEGKPSHQKISFYADDILLFQHHLQPTSKTMISNNKFSSILDYSINWNISVFYT